MSFPSSFGIPDTPLINSACSYIKENLSEAAANHCFRCAAFAAIFARNIPTNVETVVVAVLLHDMGFAKPSKDKRFEVDGANIAREFLKSHWDDRRIQLVWDSIALHTTPSIALHKESEVAVTDLGIMADLFGPHLPGNPITQEQYQEIAKAFPRLNFKTEMRDTFCTFCRDKPETTIDNVVGEYGKVYGFDGKGGEKDKFMKICEENDIVKRLEGGMGFLENYEK